MDLITTKICMASDIGIHGNLFGGFMMAWMDEAAAAYASKACESSSVVTLKFSELIFKKPVKKGDLINIFGAVFSIGRTSITINLEVRKVVPETLAETVVTTASVVFVKIDSEGNPAEISSRIKRKFFPEKYNQHEVI